MNTPNKLSLTRIILVPVIMFFYLASFVPYGKFVAFGLFIIAALTDFFDGRIARKYNLVTNLGKFIDPIGDKLLVNCSLILVAVDGTIPAPYGAIALAIYVGRDLVIDMLRQVACTRGIVIAADQLGKYKAFIQDIAVPALILYSALASLAVDATLLAVFMWIAYGFLIVATVLTIASLINYLVKNRAVFSDKKED